MARILVADDDELMIALIGAHIGAAGHTLAFAADGREALARVAERQPDALILDAVMPVLGGLDVLRHLRADPATASLPVLMLSARQGEDDVGAFLQAGASEYLAKPFSAPELVMRLEMMLRNAARGREGR